MAEKLTIAKKLHKRKYRPPARLITMLYKTIMVNIVGRKYKPKFHIIDDVNDCDGPCFVIFNHLSRIDHMYVMGATYPRRTNMMASYSEFFRKKFSFVFALNKVIPKKNYAIDKLYIRAISDVFKKGGCVTFSPEGLASEHGGNKPIVPGTSKLFKHFKVPVYLCYLEGQYLQNTKVCLDERLGETHATVSLLFSKDDVEKMSTEEMDDIINEKFRRNEYEWNAEKKIKWKTYGRICHRLEDICYKCPKCGKEFTMKGEGDKITCSNCGNGASMDDYYQFHPFEGAVIPPTPFDWVQNERMDIIKEIRQNPDYYFEDECQIGNLDEYKLVGNNKTSFIVGEGKIRIDHKGMHYKGTRNGEPYEFTADYKSLYTLITEIDTTFFNFYLKGEYFDVIPRHQTVGKICLLVEEMHRYHVNYYKNFKWNDYMYEGMELGIDFKESKTE
ncbi:MAG: 1-acyl-sn-glycerol-3-phosphate acyltransferase [Clostridia bacterium]|nr:1-acyl-sn-glycerol-3-phosphate acyltransferase [Clostridia bacterium]